MGLVTWLLAWSHATAPLSRTLTDYHAMQHNRPRDTVYRVHTVITCSKTPRHNAILHTPLCHHACYPVFNVSHTILCHPIPAHPILCRPMPSYAALCYSIPSPFSLPLPLPLSPNADSAPTRRPGPRPARLLLLAAACRACLADCPLRPPGGRAASRRTRRRSRRADRDASGADIRSSPSHVHCVAS